MNSPLARPAVRTACPYCGVGCGVLARPDGLGGATVEGDPCPPANFGRLCSKGSALGETLSLDGRLLYPMIRGAAGSLARVSWDRALDRVANAFQETIARHGPDSAAFYVSGQLLTEDYYVANKLMKGFLGSANIDTNSRLCMASSVAGHKRAFGADAVPGCYEDLDEADLLVLVGSNAAWCHPVLHQRMQRNRAARGAKIVVIDPRATATAEEADLFLPLAPGSDAALFSGLLVHLAKHGALNRAFIGDHTDGFSETLARARHLAPDIEAAASLCEVPARDIALFFQWFQAAEKTVTAFSQGVNQSAQGTDKVNAIVNCHLATGRIGRPGMGPFSLTGQPNAMGGREAGGLANQLAAHMGFETESVDRVRRFWAAPHMAEREGLKAVQLFDAIAEGRVRALWVMATNPAVSLPRADAAREALGKLDFLAVSDVVLSNDTISAGAHVLLPAAAWGEKGGTVTNSERRVSRQRAFLAAPGETKPDWWMVAEVAKRMGFGAAFDYASEADVFREHARLSAFENEGTRAFDLSGLSDLSADEYESLEPVQWPVFASKAAVLAAPPPNLPRKGGGMASSARRAKSSLPEEENIKETSTGSLPLAGRDRVGGTPTAETSARLFAGGRFFTPNRRARFIPIAPPRLADPAVNSLPLLLNTGRVRDQWHTMTRTGKSPLLGAHIGEPFVAVHPRDAERAAVADGALARVATLHGSAVLRAIVTESQRPGEIFAPIHWSGETASHARVGALAQPACDPFSGQPELKATPAALAPARYAAHGFLLARSPPALPAGLWWARAAIEGGAGYRLASAAPFEDWPALARGLLAGEGALTELCDAGQGRYRAALIRDNRVESCLFLARDPAALPGWMWLKERFAEPTLSDAARRALLLGRAPNGAPDDGPIVCACFGVGARAIRAAIGSGCASPAGIGVKLKAGTNCGSCIPELKRLISQGE